MIAFSSHSENKKNHESSYEFCILDKTNVTNIQTKWENEPWQIKSLSPRLMVLEHLDERLDELLTKNLTRKRGIPKFR